MREKIIIDGVEYSANFIRELPVEIEGIKRLFYRIFMPKSENRWIDLGYKLIVSFDCQGIKFWKTIRIAREFYDEYGCYGILQNKFIQKTITEARKRALERKICEQ